MKTKTALKTGWITMRIAWKATGIVLNMMLKTLRRTQLGGLERRLVMLKGSMITWTMPTMMDEIMAVMMDEITAVMMVMADLIIDRFRVNLERALP